MATAMPESFNIDTSISGNGGIAGSVQTGAAGLDSGASPWMDQSLFMPHVSAEDFSAAVGTGGMKFSDTPLAKSDGTLRGDVVKYAKQFLGMQYKWGGSSPGTSFDCSGFTQYVLKHFGVNLPRVSYQQARFGQQVSLAQARAGDLIAWDNSTRNDGADHIALYLGNGRIMEFYRTGRPSRIRQLGSREAYWAVHIQYPGEK